MLFNQDILFNVVDLPNQIRELYNLKNHVKYPPLSD